MSEPADLSVVLVAPGGGASVRRTMRALRAQTISERLQMVIVVPSVAELGPEMASAHGFAALRAVEVGPIVNRGQAAAVGIQAATSPVVVLVEDHSYPEPGWASALLAAHAGPWIGVGPAVENANPASAVSRVVFWLSYIAMTGRQKAGPRRLLPWHNSAYKRDALFGYGESLGTLLAWEGNLQADLLSHGHQLYFEPAARTHHMNVSRLASAVGLHFQRGRIFAGQRADRGRWPVWRRALYALASPSFPAMQLRHIAPELRRTGVAVHSLIAHAPVFALLLASMAAGEAVGFLAGVGDAIDRFEDYELRRQIHLRRGDRESSELTGV